MDLPPEVVEALKRFKKAYGSRWKKRLMRLLEEEAGRKEGGRGDTVSTPKESLCEWASSEDEEAYRGL